MTKHIISIGVLLFFSIFGSFAQSNTIRFSHLSIEDGISQATILGITQDSLGFLWLGTADGLNRFDGYGFEQFRHDPSDPGSISDNEIMALYDSGEHLWIGSARGIDIFSKNSAKCTHFNYDWEDPNSISDNYITVIHEDKDQSTWIGTANGLNKYDPNRQSFKRYFPGGNNITDLKSNFIRGITVTNKGSLWIGTDQGAYLFDRNNERFLPLLATVPGLPSLDSYRFSVILEDSDRNLWFGSEKGLYQTNSTGKKLLKSYRYQQHSGNGLCSDFITSIYEDTAGILWIGTDKGLNRLDKNNGHLTSYKSDPLDQFSISNNYIHSILEDISGILWVGTGSGLNKFDRRAFQFNPLKLRPSQNINLVDNKIWAIYEDSESKLWVGTEMGFHECDMITNRMIDYVHDPENPKSLSNNIVNAILEDTGQIFWVGTAGGLNKFDEKTETFESYSHVNSDSKVISNDPIRALAHDGTEGLWLGTPNGLSRFNKSDNSFSEIKFALLGKNIRGINSIRILLKSNNGPLWVGTEGGLVRFNGGEEEITLFDYNPQDSTSLSHNFVRSLHEDEHGNLWVGTSGGLNLMNKDTHQFKHFRIKDGMPNDVVNAIEEDREGNLWISTNNGVAKFNPANGVFKNFDMKDGLQSNEFNSNASFSNKNGVMFFGGINGLNIFHPDNIKDNQFIPPVVFTGFEILNKSVTVGESYPLQKTINTVEEIFLGYKDYMFTFQYAALNFTNPEKNKYKFKLEGFDKDWNEVGTRRFATYTNIPGGNYVFKVKASNNSGIWNEAGTSVKINIAAPFWHNAWFQILVIFFAILLGYVFYRYRIRLIQAKKEELERVVAERTKKIFQQKTRLETSNSELNATLNKLKETQAQLIQSEKMATLGQLTAGVAHEINNPINFIYSGINGLEKNLKAYMKVSQQYEKIKSSRQFDVINKEIEVLKSKIGYEEVIKDIHGMMDSIREGAERTTNIVKSLQSFSRSDNTSPEKMDIHEGLDSTLKILSNRIGKNIIIYKKYHPSLSEIDCFPGQLNQVFMNILVNATEAIGENEGNITIETKQKEEEIIILFKDTGDGIDASVQSKVFEPFYTTKEVGKGTGLGLSISYGIIKKHRGTITCNSEIGQGTEFIITLPNC